MTLDDETLAEKCRDSRRRAETQDEDAWAELKRRFQNLVRWKVIATAISTSSADVDDYVGEVWLKLLQEIHRYDRQRGRFSSFLLSLTHNLVVDSLRVKHREIAQSACVVDSRANEPIALSPPVDLLDTVVTSVDRTLSDPRKRLIFGELQAGERVAEISRRNGFDPTFVRRTRKELEQKVRDLLQEIVPTQKSYRRH